MQKVNIGPLFYLWDVADVLIPVHVEEDDVGKDGLLVHGRQVVDDPQPWDQAAVVLQVWSALKQLDNRFQPEKLKWLIVKQREVKRPQRRKSKSK